VNVVAAVLAGVRGHIAQAVELGVLLALGAIELCAAVANFHKVIKTRIVVWEPLEELTDCEFHGYTL
jgi:Flp pilus assembly pilin Flp